MNKRRLIAILLLALAVRLQLFLAAPDLMHIWTEDSQSYSGLAAGMVAYGVFGEANLRYAPPPRSEIFRTPGYPAFLVLNVSAVALAKPNMSTFGGELEVWVTRCSLGCQIALDVLLVGLTCSLGARLVGPGTGLAAGLLQAISPLAVGSSCRLLSDSLYAFVFTAAILSMIAYLRGGRWRVLVASAAALGAASYVRPVGLAMAPIFALVVFLRPIARHVHPAFQAPAWRGIALRALVRFARAAAFLALFAACLAPWVIRNGIRADYWGFSSAYGDTLYGFALPRIIAMGESTDDADARGALDHDLGEYEEKKGGTLSVGEAARWREGKAMQVILAHPRIFAFLHLKGSVAFWLPATDMLEIAGLVEGRQGTLGVLQDQGLWAAIRNYFGDNWKAAILAVPITIFTFVQYLAGLLCAVRGVRRTRFRLPAEVWLLVLVVFVSAAMPGVVAHPRFRVPVEPILNVAAAAGLVGLLRRRPSDVPAASVPDFPAR